MKSSFFKLPDGPRIEIKPDVKVSGLPSGKSNLLKKWFKSMAIKLAYRTLEKMEALDIDLHVKVKIYPDV